jgi:hypothetical protein
VMNWISTLIIKKMPESSLSPSASEKLPSMNRKEGPCLILILDFQVPDREKEISVAHK